MHLFDKRLGARRTVVSVQRLILVLCCIFQGNNELPEVIDYSGI